MLLIQMNALALGSGKQNTRRSTRMEEYNYNGFTSWAFGKDRIDDLSKY